MATKSGSEKTEVEAAKREAIQNIINDGILDKILQERMVGHNEWESPRPKGDLEALAQDLAEKHMAGKSIKYTMVCVARQNGKEWLRNRVNEILKEAGCDDVF